MASLGDVVISRALRHSALSHNSAQEAIRPLWDNLTDFLLYALVLLGLVVLPTAYLNGTPLACTLCRPGICPNNGSFDFTLQDPGFSSEWVKLYCTYTSVNSFVMYFPYLLLITALALLLIERAFSHLFKTSQKLDAFYKLLVNESILDNAMTTITNDKHQVTGAKFLELQDTKMVYELVNSFSQSSSYFYFYLFRSVTEFSVSGGLFFWLYLVGLPAIAKVDSIYCPISQEYLYHCSGHPQKFYLYATHVAIAILGLYYLCCSFNLLWLIMPQFGRLNGLMHQFRSEFRKDRQDQVDNQDISDQELLGDLFDVYYNNKDLTLLLDLLASTAGVGPCLRLLCLFDKSLRKKAEVARLHVNVRHNDKTDQFEAVVKFDDPPGMKALFGKVPKCHCIFTIEIIPSIPSGSIHALKYKSGLGSSKLPAKMNLNCSDMDSDLEDELEMISIDPVGRHMVKFIDIDPTVEYSFRVCTLLNGQAISRRSISLRNASI